MEKTVFQQGGGAMGATPNFQPQNQGNGMNAKKTIYPGMANAATSANSACTATHNTPIAGFLYSVSRTMAGEFWPIYEGPNKIGRSVEAVVQLNDPLISENHATLVVRPMYNQNQKTGILVYVQDDASTCGTMLNGNSLGFEPKECHHGDILTIGPNYELYLILVDAASVGLAPKEALQNIPPVAAPQSPVMANGWGSAQPGMSSANGPKGTVFQPGAGAANANNPLSAPGATVYMPGK